LAKPEDITLEDKAGQWDRLVATNDPTEIANKAIVARYVYATNVNDFDSFDSYVAEDYVEHDPIPGQEPGREGLKAAYKIFAGPFPDAYFVFADLICEGDMVFGRGEISGTHQGEFFGIPPSGKKVQWTGTRLFKVRDGIVTDGWFNVNMVGLLQQMGAIPGWQEPPATPPLPTGSPGTREESRQIMETLMNEIWGKGRIELADELFHPQAICPSAATLPVGPEGTKQIVQMVRSAFPDYWIKIETLAAEADRVAARITQGGTHEGEFFGVPATGKTVEWSEMAILRIGDGRILGTWFDTDLAGLFQQLGVGQQAEAEAPA
jgi:predicted ester cyclase